jgi:hypothetical protein
MTTDTNQEVQTMAPPVPEKEHKWLQRFLGEWIAEGEDGIGTETGRAMGDVWIVVEGSGGMPGGDDSITQVTQLTLGYDPTRKRFVGSWVGSMMAYQWVYDGELDAAGNVLTLNCEGPAFDGSGKMMPYRDVHEFVSDDHRQLKAYTQNEDGTWNHFMTTDYRRKK